MKLLTERRYEERRQAVQRMVHAYSVRHFSADELYRHTHEDWPHERLYPPPTRLAPRMGPTLEVAEQLREEWGGPVEVVSGWRAPTYNDLLRSADGEHAASEDSQHMWFRALDLRPVEPRSDDYAVWIEHCEEIVHETRTTGTIVGFGRYASFVHIDTGHYRYNRNWTARSG